jgi:hypothetical protein
MWSPLKGASAVLLGSLTAIAALASCWSETPTAANDDQASVAVASQTGVRVCHRTGSSGTIITVPASELPEHLKQGDYLTNLAVSHGSQPQDGAHFGRISDALAAARSGRLKRGEFRAAACRVTIAVAPGVFRGTVIETGDPDVEVFPLTVDVPKITLRGALVMQLNASGRATGASLTHQATTLVLQPGADGFAPPIVLANAHPSGSAGHGLTVEGFAFQSGNGGGFGVFSMRTKGLVIRGNRFEDGFGFMLDLRASGAVIERNLMRGALSCDVCLAGPGAYRVTGNRILEGGIEGIAFGAFAGPFNLVGGVEPLDVPAGSAISVDITNNEVRDHQQLPAGGAIRVGGISPGVPDVRGTAHVTIHDNLLLNNLFAVVLDAGFPVPDTKLRADFDVTLAGNILQRSCQADLYVAFTRHSDGLGTGGTFLEHSTYRLTLNGNLPFRDVWFRNPPGFGNALVVNGRTIPNGTRTFYDELGCPGRTTLSSTR